MIKWIAIALGSVSTVALVALLVVLLQVGSAVSEVNAQLPELLENTRQTSETMSAVAKDISDLRRLTGAESKFDRNHLDYANEVMDLVEARLSDQGVRIGVEEIIGTDVGDTEPIESWIVDARREAALQLFRVSSKAELLEKLTHSWTGKPWLLVLPGSEEPVELGDWIREHHEESRGLE